MVAAPINHICLDDRGVAYLAGSRIKVQQIVIAHYDLNRTPEQIQEDYPHLSLAQIHAALSYYHDHRARMDAEIAEADRFAEEMRSKNPNQMTREQFKARLQQKQKDTAA